MWHSGNDISTTHFSLYFYCIARALCKNVFCYCGLAHYIDVIMTTMASQITSLTVVYLTVYSDADQGKHQNSTSLAFVQGIHRDRWIPRTKGQLRGKCFHLMTSSWPIISLRTISMSRRLSLHQRLKCTAKNIISLPPEKDRISTLYVSCKSHESTAKIIKQHQDKHAVCTTLGVYYLCVSL